ncbi:hypothetical protein D1007_57766 [Hordeum vulgare]|nr:hypothetical protein D1007_57766 [Hordeum vulgare]
MAPKTNKAVNWTKSIMSELVLQDWVDCRFLPPKGEIQWCAREEETNPRPGQNEIICFVDHIDRGFHPCGSKFFRDVLHHFNIKPQDLGPKSILNLYQFQAFCKMYLQMETKINLFKEFLLQPPDGMQKWIECRTWRGHCSKEEKLSLP